METLESAKILLDTMLGYLGLPVLRIETENDSQRGLTLQIFTDEADLLIGRDGERLDDIQYLVNRLLQQKNPEGGRVRVDVEYFRAMREDELVEQVRQMGERVRSTGRPARLHPMNSYDRRIVHNVFSGDPEIETWSPPDHSRMKRITIRRKRGGGAHQSP